MTPKTPLSRDPHPGLGQGHNASGHAAALALPQAPVSRMNRNVTTVTTVVGLHLAAIWALHVGLQARDHDTVVPVTVLAELIPPASPQGTASAPAPATTAPATTAPATPPAPPLPAPPPSPAHSRPASPAALTAQPLTPVPSSPPSAAAPATAAAPAAPAASAAPASAASAPAPAAAPVAAPAAAPAPPKLELPSSNADYLNNPRPPYPALAKRLGEQGTVVVRVLIETDGTASKAELRSSSGYDSLDQAALKAVLKWRYVPGKRNGVPEPMWFNIPIEFNLKPAGPTPQTPTE